MCRNIRPLFNYAPPTTEDEVRASALQYVRKVSGYAKPSLANEAAFDQAVDRVTLATTELMAALVTAAPPRDRQAKALKARERAQERYRRAIGGLGR